MELTKEEKEMLKRIKTKKQLVLPEQRSPDYYEGFYDAVHLVITALKEKERN